jgi:sulfite reductase (NADPH) flavoprotein alpha-component
LSATASDITALSPDDLSVLDRILARATPSQRQWLGGYVAGWQAAASPAAPVAKTPITILYASESGNAESLAHAAGKAARKLGFAPRVVDMADTTPTQIAKAGRLLVVASTWGEGDPPQRAEPFIAALAAADAPSFFGTRFAVLALGDRAYVNFCVTGKALDARLAELGAERLEPVVECDLDFAAPARGWTERVLEGLGDGPSADVIHIDFARQIVEEPDAGPRVAQVEVSLHQELHSSRSEVSTTHLEVSLAGSGITYQPGDALDVHVPNDPALVEAVLGAAGLDDPALRETLAARDIATLTAGQVAAYAEATGDSGLARLAADSQALPAWLEGRQLLDLVAEGGHRLAPEALLALTRPLAPRAYSIASSQALVGEEAHLLVGLVRWEKDGHERQGVASGHLARRVRAGDALRVSLRPNKHFRLPTDDRPIVMIGPGTGLAPFRAFLQEREATGHDGRSWLFFGHRRFTHDFLYQIEIQEWLKTGVLSRLDVAFSRDQPEKIYVQHRLWQQRAELRAWIEDGAALYVCGDAKAMARDVHATLLRILGEGSTEAAAAALLRAMQQDGRYLRDVY